MKTVLRDVTVTVDGTDLSDHFSAITVEDGAADVDGTAFGSVYTQTLKGMRTAQITGTLQQDFDAGSVDAVHSVLNDQDLPFKVIVKPTSGAVSATNPAFVLPEGQLLGYNPLSGSVGDLSTTDITYSNAGDQGVVRVTNPADPLLTP
jgi:hypothetical protein